MAEDRWDFTATCSGFEHVHVILGGESYVALLETPDDIAKMRNDLRFLERLGSELTTPVLPQGAAVDYIPSQFLCEFIKNHDYDGVLYRSSVSDGINLACSTPRERNVVPWRSTGSVEFPWTSRRTLRKKRPSSHARRIDDLWQEIPLVNCRARHSAR